MTDTSARRLVVIRHAKTEQFASSDHQRELTEQGRHDSAGIGRWLESQGVRPEVVLVSSAARARATAELLCAELSTAPEVSVVDALYGADGREALEQCQALSDDVACAAIVGHNPTMAVLAHALASDDDAIGHFPTSAAAVLAFSGGWADLDEGAAALEHLHAPHGS